MAVVVTQHSAIVQGTALQIDLGKAVAGDFAVFKPDLLFQQRAFSSSFEAMLLKPDGADWRLFGTHGEIVAQVGSKRSFLLFAHGIGFDEDGGQRV